MASSSTILLSPTTQLSLQTNVAKTLSLLERCSNMEELKQFHAQMLKTGLLLDSKVASKLLAFCASPEYGNLGYAQMVFDRLSRPNTLMWNTMIRGYSNSNEPEKALLVYYHMVCNGASHNAYTFPFLLKACSKLPAMEEMRQIHGHLLKLGYALEVYATNALIHGYATGGDLESSHILFNQLPHKDIVSWNSILNGYTKRGDMEMAGEMFKNMPETSVVSWTAMICGHTAVGQNKEALNLFHLMLKSGVQPDNVVLASALSACAHLGALEQGRWIHTYITRNRNRIHMDQVLGSALIDMYAKCGDMAEAQRVFTRMKKRGVVAWTSMISGFAIHGEGREALEWFTRMQEQGVEPNAITFTAVLTGCSHAGLVEEGKQMFKSMIEIHNLKPSMEHYGCMVDLLGRAGLLEEAKGFIEKMPVKPSVPILGAMVNACRIHGDLELGKQMGRLLVEEDPAHGGRYVHLASIYAAGGEWGRAANTRHQMKQFGVRKIPGCSAVTINGTLHEFVAGDGSHPEIKEIDGMWERIWKRLRRQGYKSNVGSLVVDLDDQHKEVAIHRHSEKLAISYGLIRTKPGTTIRIVKNLRVCEDCHMVTKLISKIYDREIVMRDRSRFHVFRNGHCSCWDFW